MTGRHRGPKKKLLPAGYKAQSLSMGTVPPMYALWGQFYFSSSCVVSHAFSAHACAYSTFRHHSHPLGNPCVKCRFCHNLHCWASLRRKNRIFNQSLSHSLTHLAYLMSQEPKLLLWNNKLSLVLYSAKYAAALRLWMQPSYNYKVGVKHIRMANAWGQDIHFGSSWPHIVNIVMCSVRIHQAMIISKYN